MSPSKLTQSQLIDDIQASSYLNKSVAQFSRRKSPSPTRAEIISGYMVDGPYDSELNRAVARSMYVDATVNVVNPTATTGKLRKDAVKAGQMNLFNPAGIKGLPTDAHTLYEIYGDIPQPVDMSPRRQQNIT